MGEGVFIQRKVVVDDMADVVDIEPSGSEIRRDEGQCGASGKAVKGTFAIALLHAAMEGADGKALLLQIGGHALHALTIVHEDHGRLGPQMAKQITQGEEFVLLRRANEVQGKFAF